MKADLCTSYDIQLSPAGFVEIHIFKGQTLHLKVRDSEVSQARVEINKHLLDSWCVLTATKHTKADMDKGIQDVDCRFIWMEKDHCVTSLPGVYICLAAVWNLH